MQLKSSSTAQQRAFVKAWPLSKVKKMKLTAYTATASKFTFCYALEFLTDENGSIRGGSAYKFGIFKRGNAGKALKAKHLVTDGEYAWYRKYGSRRDAAFRKIRSHIVAVIEAAQAQRFDQIDKIDLGLAIKWKIAYLYAPASLVPIYSCHVLSQIAFVSGLADAHKAPISALQAFLMSHKAPKQTSADYALELWQSYVSIRPGEADQPTWVQPASLEEAAFSQVAEPQAMYSLRAQEQFDSAAIFAECIQTEEEIQEILNIWRKKKNIILQGPPGVGKSFLAKRLSWLLTASKAEQRQAWVQFHPNYAYEDFVMGLRPDGHGHFQLQPGKFLSFCVRAAEDVDRPYVFVIDEINRAHLSKVLGELMYLLEADKRSKSHAIQLSYDIQEQAFFIPPNLHLIGTMNTADRSLALMDYALRRRFAFINLDPIWDKRFLQKLVNQGVSKSFAQQMTANILSLNEQIAKDRHLGPGYAIGHSFFIASHPIADQKKWYERIIAYEIAPLLQAYWFDQRQKAEDLIQELKIM